MKNIIKHVMFWVVGVITLTLHSCNFLNVNDYFEETLKYDSIFTSKRNFERYLWATAGQFPDEGYTRVTYSSFTSDEAFSLTEFYLGMQYVNGKISPTNVGTMYRWDMMYIIIRKANTLLANIDKAADMTNLEKREILGYIYFMRAYAYYQLLMQFGPIVILGDDVLDTNEEASYYDKSRETFDSSVDFVCAELEKAAAYLPQTVSYTYFGRPIRGAALGLIARLRLIQASPLWNGGTAARRTYGTWKRSSDGAHYASQTPDEGKWATAAMACKRIIDMGIYSLHTVSKMPDTDPLPANVSDLPFPDGAGDIDPFRSYADMFSGETLSQRNSEILWGRVTGSIDELTRGSFPILNMEGLGNVCITQKVVDAYLMADGRTIENSSVEYPYSTVGFMGGANKTFSGYRLNSTVSNMYVNREKRFYASIGFCQAFWLCNSTSDDSKRNQTFTYYADGNAGKQSTYLTPLNYPITGYVLKKYVHEDDAWAGDYAKRIPKCYSMIRYAEILLAYVEALNNLTKSHTIEDEYGNIHVFTRDENEMAKYFNMVRFRAGLPGLTVTELASVETMQSLIERERMVEFLFENMRYFDVRRWGKYEQTEGEPIMGMDTDATRTGGYYNVVPVNHSIVRNRVVDRKLILYPIDLYEVRKASSLDQNPGWQN